MSTSLETQYLKPGFPAQSSASRETKLGKLQKDYLFLTLFVLAKNGYAEKARILAQALYASGDRSSMCLWANAVLAFEYKDLEGVLPLLSAFQQRQETEKEGLSRGLFEKKRQAREKLHFYMAARCYHELGNTDLFYQTLETQGLNGGQQRRNKKKQR